MLSLLELIHEVKEVRSFAKTVFDARNAAVHFASVSSDDACFVAFISAVDGLLDSEEELRSYWGEATELVVGLRDKVRTQRQRVFDGRMTAARRQLAATVRFLKQEEAERVLDALEARRQRVFISNDVGDDTVDFACPVCTRRAYLHRLHWRRDDFETHVERSGSVFDVWVSVTVDREPVFLECPVCGLELDEEVIGLLPGVEAVTDQDVEVVEGDERDRYLRDAYDGSEAS